MRWIRRGLFIRKLTLHSLIIYSFVKTASASMFLKNHLPLPTSHSLSHYIYTERERERRQRERNYWCWSCIYIYIYIYHRNAVYIYIYIYHIVPLARTSMTLSRHFSLSFIASGRSSGLHPVSSHSCYMYVRAGCPAFARPFVCVPVCVCVNHISLLVWVLWHINLWRLFNAKSIFIQTNSFISNNSV